MTPEKMIDISIPENTFRRLKDLFQNPIYDDESSEESKFRYEMWHILDDVDLSLPRRRILREGAAEMREKNWMAPEPEFNPDEDIPF